ncbi:MFS transporter [Capsulimonas corticalis]|uniref:MFS transporter n=1 Tax=Capsulimonas corticalis TaxID=2219043 RepID=A0A402CUY9_9BACT|nr:MFS transporter [Capsulimonas corticalis]BDI30210.1 MFS transporter [Capsulimonas corticalis]
MKKQDRVTNPVSVHGAADRVVVLGAVCLAGLVLPLSFAGAAVATPAIGRELGGSPTALNWIVNAFMLSFGSTLMAAGALADEYGRRRIFAIGVALFAAISLAIGFAPNVVWLDFLRAGQGTAAAATLAGGAAALAQEFSGSARTRAYSLLGATFGAGLAFGPVLAGFLIHAFGWRSIFLTGVVIGAVALIFGVPLMRESRDPDAAGLDAPGAAAFTGFLSLLICGVLQAPSSGWGSPAVTAFFMGSALMLALFIVAERRSPRPMLDLSLFRYPLFLGVQVLPLATAFCYVVLLVLLPVRLIGVEGRNEVEAGAIMISLSTPLLAAPLWAWLLAQRFSAGAVSGTGLLIASAGLVWLSHVGPGSPGGALILPMLLIGVGASIPWGLMDGLSISVVPRERAGMATGIFSTTRIAGEAVMIALVAALMATLTQAQLGGAFSGDSPEHIARAAQYIAAGDLTHAARFLPAVSHTRLVQVYGNAFRVLILLLAAATFASALTVFAFLGRVRAPAEPKSEEAPELAARA